MKLNIISFYKSMRVAFIYGTPWMSSFKICTWCGNWNVKHFFHHSCTPITLFFFILARTTNSIMNFFYDLGSEKVFLRPREWKKTFQNAIVTIFQLFCWFWTIISRQFSCQQLSNLKFSFFLFLIRISWVNIFLFMQSSDCPSIVFCNWICCSLLTVQNMTV